MLSCPRYGSQRVDSDIGISREDHPLPEAQLPTANLRNVTPGYFEALQIPILDGEDFKESERDHPQDGIISQSTARRQRGRGKVRLDGIFASTVERIV